MKIRIKADLELIPLRLNGDRLSENVVIDIKNKLSCSEYYLNVDSCEILDNNLIPIYRYTYRSGIIDFKLNNKKKRCLTQN